MSDEGDSVPTTATHVFHDLLGVAGLSRWATTVTRGLFAGFARVYEDGFASSLANRRGKGLLALSKAQTDADSYRRLKEAIDAADISKIETRASIEAQAEQIRHQTNLESVARFALAHVQESAADPNNLNPTPLDEDWLEDFRDIARRTNKEYMQRLLGKLIAEEAAHPDRYPVSALLKIKTLSQRSLASFQKVGALYFNNFGIINCFSHNLNEDEILVSMGLKYDDFLTCEREGLIDFRDNLGVAPNESEELSIGNRKFLIKSTENSVPAFVLTPVGMSIAQLMDFPNPPQLYISAAISLIRGSGIEIEEL